MNVVDHTAQSATQSAVHYAKRFERQQASPSKATVSDTQGKIDANDQAPKLHIVVVTETWLPDINGVASSMFQIVQQLKQFGHDITLIRPSQSEQVEKDLQQSRLNLAAVHHDKQVKSLPIPYYPHLRMGLPSYRYLREQFASLQPDVVHIITEGPLGFAALLAAKRQKIKVTAGYHTSFHDFSRYFGWKIVSMPMLGYLKRFHNACNATCVPSATTLEQLSGFGFKRLYQVGRGVDTQKFAPTHRSAMLRQRWQAGEETTVLMCVSRVSPEKGIETVIKGFKALQLEQLHRHVKLVIVGDGPDKTRLETLYGDDADIVFAGFKTGHELADYYASGDAFVFGSQVETFGNVVTEAMASGLPVFAYHDAAAALLVDKSCGSTVALGDEKAFIKMVQQLPKQQQLQRMQTVACERVAGFSWQRPAEQMQAMFYQVLQLDSNAEISNVKNSLSKPKEALPLTNTEAPKPPKALPVNPVSSKPFIAQNL